MIRTSRNFRKIGLIKKQWRSAGLWIEESFFKFCKWWARSPTPSRRASMSITSFDHCFVPAWQLCPSCLPYATVRSIDTHTRVENRSITWTKQTKTFFNATCKKSGHVHEFPAWEKQEFSSQKKKFTNSCIASEVIWRKHNLITNFLKKINAQPEHFPK